MYRALKRTQGYIAARILIGIIGVLLSVVLHELFHIAMHWQHIRHIELFPNLWTVVEIDAWMPPGYDLNGEEIAAYGITLGVLLITTVIIFRIKDSEDERTSSQILFPQDRKMQKLSPAELLELSHIDDSELPSVKKAKIRKRVFRKK